MNDFWLPMALSIIFQVIKQSIKNPRAKADLKSAMLKLRNQINLMYVGDPDFE